MAAMIHLDSHLTASEIPDSMDRDWLTDIVLQPLGIQPETTMADLCEDILLSSAEASVGELHMRPGGWKINIADSFVRTVIASSIVGAALITVGADQIPLNLLPAVLPLLVDIKSVRLDRRDRVMLVALRPDWQGIEGMALHPEVLYGRLDSSTRDQLNYYDFISFAERLIHAGELDDAGLGDLSVREAEPAWIRITWE